MRRWVRFATPLTLVFVFVAWSAAAWLLRPEESGSLVLLPGPVARTPQRVPAVEIRPEPEARRGKPVAEERAPELHTDLLPGLHIAAKVAAQASWPPGACLAAIATP